MSKFAESDFYYGAILSFFINNGIYPALVEPGKDRQIYEFTTDQGDFKLFTKYRSIPTTSSEAYTSWTFIFTDNDIKELNEYLASSKHLSVGLICGDSTLSSSLLAFLHKEEIQALFDAGKKSFTISHEKNDHHYKISMGGGRDNCLKIKSNRPF